MPTDPSVSFTSRLPSSMLARLDALAVAMSEAAAGAKVSRSDAMRAAIEAGLPNLEARYGIEPKEQKPARKPAKK